MRIDEVIQEAPFGGLRQIGQKMDNFGNKFAAALGDKQAGNLAVAGKVKLQAMKKADDINNDFVQWKAITFPQGDMEVVRVSEVLRYLKDKHKITNLTKQGLNSIAPILKQSGRQLKEEEWEKVFYAIALRSLQDSDGDGTPDAKDTSPGSDTADGTLSPADSALKSALDKLDPQMQAKALQYLQSKK